MISIDIDGPKYNPNATVAPNVETAAPATEAASRPSTLPTR
jgi:hypothetical protein